MPTDKLFTSQRLDATGLYYYNARYYDPQIGRFISADTIIPHPANPQSFNRYSYVLNNPLKYIDPSGHIVEIGGVNVADIDAAVASFDYNKCVELADAIHTAGVGDLIIAYGTLRSIAPELTGLLEKDDNIVKIQYKDLDVYGETDIDVETGNIDINIDNDVALMEDKFLICLMAHESFHSAIDTVAYNNGVRFGIKQTTYAQEAFANSLAYSVGQAMKYPLGIYYLLAERCKDVNPWNFNQTVFNQAKVYIKVYYGELEDWGPMGSEFGDKEGFLTVARSVWVN